jgi:DNA replication protein DnaC
MGTEAAAAEARKLASRLHWAALPAPWRIEDYDFAAQPGADQSLIRELATLRFLDDIGNHRYQNVLNDPLRDTCAA